MEQQPDRLIAFLDAMCGESGAGMETVQELVDEATERNLTVAGLAVPGTVLVDGEEVPFDPSNEMHVAALPVVARYAFQLHVWAWSLTGAPSNTRRAVSQVGGADVLQYSHAGYVGEVMAVVADKIARAKEGDRS